MAIIGKIREKSWLILVIVGGALIAFILGDWQRISGGLEEVYGLGTVYGEKVDPVDFQEAINIQRVNNERTAEQQNKEPEPVDESAVWKSFVQDLVIRQEYDALGITVGQNEFDAYLFGEDGFEVMPDLASNFKDSATGMFNKNLLQAKIDDMKSSEKAEDQKLWEEIEQGYIEKRKREKYFQILQQGIYVTKLEAKEDYYAQKEKKSISFVLRRYSEIKDEDIEVTDEDLKAYFEEHKDEKKYENKESMRSINFFDIAIQPSAEDSAKFHDKMETYRNDLATAENDSAYIVKYSDMRFFTTNPYSTALPESHRKAKQHLTFPRSMDSTFMNSSVGDIIGPYEHMGTFNIAKIIGFTEDTINARHILIPVTEGQESVAEARVDSILAVINHDNFTEFVNKYSTDTGSKEKGGELGDFFFSEMVQPFAVYCADKPIGEIGQVRSQYGIHIIEVLDRKGPKYPRLGIISKTLKTSDATLSEIETSVYKLLWKLDDEMSKAKDAKEMVAIFDTVAKQEGYFSRPVNISEKSPRMTAFNTKLAEDKILELAFKEEAAVGDLIESPIRDQDKFLIAVLAAIRTEGETNFEDVEDKVRANYIQDQKVKRLKAQMMKKTLTELASDANPIQKADVTFANPQIASAGFEAGVVGALYTGLKDGQQTQPIEGKQGVYVIRIDRTDEVPVAKDYEVERNQLLSTARAKLSGDAVKGLIERADVIDNRRFYSIGLRR